MIRPTKSRDPGPQRPGMLAERVIDIEEQPRSPGSGRLSLRFDSASRINVILGAEVNQQDDDGPGIAAPSERLEFVLNEHELRQLADVTADLTRITDELSLKNAKGVKRRLPAGGNDTTKTFWRETSQNGEMWTAIVCRRYWLRRWVVFAMSPRRKPTLQPLNDSAVILKRCWRRRDALACYQVHVEARWFWDAERTTTGWQPGIWSAPPAGHHNK